MTSFRLFFFSALLVLVLFSPTASAQQSKVASDTSRTLVQFSGMIVDADSLRPVAYVAVVIRNSNRGVYSSFSGYFSLVAQENDTVEYYALGYKRGWYVIPDTFTTTTTITHVQALRSDTVLMKEQLIYPWPSREQFKTAFLALDVPDDDLQRAQENLDERSMAAAAANVRNDATMSYRNQMQLQQNKAASAGMAQTTNLLSPIAWARFIQAARNGSLSRQ